MADLYFENWLKSRLKEDACLPLIYAVGNRFIKLEKDFPAGFRCAPLPMSLQEYREMQAIIKGRHLLRSLYGSYMLVIRSNIKNFFGDCIVNNNL